MLWKTPSAALVAKRWRGFVLMLWHGKKMLSRFKNHYRRETYRCNLRTRALAFSSPRRGNISPQVFTLYIPSQWGAVLLTSQHTSTPNKVIYIYNPVYFFKWVVAQFSLKWYFDTWTGTFSFTHKLPMYYYRVALAYFFDVFYSFSRVFFTKLTFKGKGYYIYKTARNTITHQFNYAHRWYIYAYFISVKFLTKKIVFLFGWSKRDLLTIGYQIQNCRYINIFTGRGVRFARQVIYRKTGKVSAYR
jgi:hypothetical protein